MRVILAIDSGGTKTETLLVGLDGAILGSGRSLPPDPAHASERGYGRSPAAVQEAVTQALGGRQGDELHVAMVGGAFHRGDVRKPAWAAAAEGVPEHLPAFMLTNETCGVVAMAGTGAIVHAVRPAGRELRLDGLGPLLGDHGGGFAVGLAAVRAVAQSDWHPRHATTLTHRLYAAGRATGLFADRDELTMFMLKTPDRAQIAAFAALVDQEARQGDRVAREILTAAALDCAETVRDAASQLDMLGESHALIGMGSVMMKSDHYWKAFTQAVARFAPAFRPVRLRHPAVAGMALRLLSQLNPGGYRAARQRLIEELDTRQQKG